MSKKQTEYRINTNYINLVEKLIKEKIEIEKNNNIEKLYVENLNLRFSNKDRVISRILRKEIAKPLAEELKARKIEMSKFKEVTEKLQNLKEKSSYIKVEV